MNRDRFSQILNKHAKAQFADTRYDCSCPTPTTCSDGDPIGGGWGRIDPNLCGEMFNHAKFECAGCRDSETQMYCMRLARLLHSTCKEAQNHCQKKKRNCELYEPKSDGGTICGCLNFDCKYSYLAGKIGCVTKEEYEAIISELEENTRNNYERCYRMLQKCDKSKRIVNR